jgi:DNA ligase (NAD+)
MDTKTVKQLQKLAVDFKSTENKQACVLPISKSRSRSRSRSKSKSKSRSRSRSKSKSRSKSRSIEIAQAGALLPQKKQSSCFINKSNCVSNLKSIVVEEAKRLGIEIKKSNGKLKTVRELCNEIVEDVVDKTYNEGNPIISDKEYDELFGTGASAFIVPKNNPTQLPVWMGSLDKIKDKKSLTLWIDRIKKQNVRHVVITPKFDGISALLTYDKNLYTRGNGSVGSNLSSLIPYLSFDSFKNPLKNKDFLRGELIIRKDVFKNKYSKEFKNARNLVAGQVSKKTPNIKILQDINFLPYEWINTSFTNFKPSKQFTTLYKNEEFPWIYLSIDDLSFDFLSETLTGWNRKLVYEIDGLVVSADIEYTSVSDGNPKMSIAFKSNEAIEAESVVATVTDVEWILSKWGAYKPTVHIKPIDISGVTVRKVTGHNAKYILDNKVGKNATIRVIRSGNVIPYIVDVIVPSIDVQLPDGEWKGVDIYAKLKSDIVNTDIEIKKLINLFKILDVKYVSEKTIEKLYLKCKLETFFDIINCTTTSLKPEFTGRSAERILEAMKELKSKKILASYLIAGSGVLGQNIGQKRASNLIKSTGYCIIPTIQQIIEVEGFAALTAAQIVQNFSTMVQFIEECKLNGMNVVWDNEQETSSKNITICQSGFRNKDLENMVNIEPNLTKNVQYLVVKDKTIKTGKVEKANKMKIPVITEDELMEILMTNG